MSDAFATVQNEYWYNVSPQDELPLAGTVEVDIDITSVSSFFHTVGKIEGSLREAVADLLIANRDLFTSVRQFLGISDKRAYLDLSYIASRLPNPNSEASLCGCYPWTLSRHPLEFFLNLLDGIRGKDVQREAALMMADYLSTHGLKVAAPNFASMSEPVLKLLYARLITPKEYQQRAAKRRGHGCEGALAKVLSEIGVSIIPTDKATNPMGSRDPNINLNDMTVVNRLAGETHSFDMVISLKDRPRVLIQSLIHTSDPGQYGVNKSDETVEIALKVKNWRAKKSNAPLELWGFLDGVGFSENKPQTLNKLLANMDYFIQYKTLYKAALRAHELSLVSLKAIQFSPNYSDEDIESIKEKYIPESIQVIKVSEAPNKAWKSVPAGYATVFL